MFMVYIHWPGILISSCNLHTLVGWEHLTVSMHLLAICCNYTTWSSHVHAWLWSWMHIRVFGACGINWKMSLNSHPHCNSQLIVRHVQPKSNCTDVQFHLTCGIQCLWCPSDTQHPVTLKIHCHSNFSVTQNRLTLDFGCHPNMGGLPNCAVTQKMDSWTRICTSRSTNAHSQLPPYASSWSNWSLIQFL
jgi:hypothetical protein